MSSKIAVTSDTFDPAAETAADGRPVLQARLRTWGKVTTFVHLAFWAAWILNNRGVRWPADALIVFALSLAMVVYIAAWTVGAGRPRSLRWLKAQDSVSFACLGVSFATGLAGHPIPHMVAFEALTGMMFLLFTRALLFPSSPRRTLLVSMLASLPPLVVAFFLRERLASPGVRPETYWASYLSWTIISCGVCTVASRVLYGLNKQVRDAKRLGQYVLLEKLGEGGMGVVYRASHAMLRRPTAIKLLSASPAKHASRRFEQEVQLMAQISHPNIVTVHDYGRTSTGIFYYAMELLDGLDLERLVQKTGAQPPPRVVHILKQAGAALRRAHRAGLVHRDVKPANIFLCRDWGEPDTVKVLDFGLVKDLKADADPALTHDQQLLGTPFYISPEACTSPASVDGRSDIYSLGAVAYFLLTGSPPFMGRTIVEVAAQHMHAPPPQISNPLYPISTELEAIIRRCLEKAPADRWTDVDAFLSALDACLESTAWSSLSAQRCWEAESATNMTPPGAESPALLDTVEVDGLLSRHPKDRQVPSFQG